MRSSLFLLAVSAVIALPADAQYATYPPTSDADQLASVIRRIAASPTDVYALVTAGELSIKLDDLSAAAAFFARADRIDGRNPRAKAGMGSILVRAERPGEALRHFQMAEQYGLPTARFAADRGLALDLLGEQERAQRDYRVSLRTGPADDETIRRYALSLGISGKREEALAQLEPLIRRQDRGAWRVRAFVLAMAGDVPGAARIATTMMPPGMASGLQPFFERLPRLPATDRAFAVHFGEVRPTPARIADARMKPYLAPLGPDPFPPTQLATVALRPPVVATIADRNRNRRDRRRGRDRVQLAARAALPAAPQPQPPAYRGGAVALARATPVPTYPRPTYTAAAAVQTPPARPGFAWGVQTAARPGAPVSNRGTPARTLPPASVTTPPVAAPSPVVASRPAPTPAAPGQLAAAAPSRPVAGPPDLPTDAPIRFTAAPVAVRPASAQASPSQPLPAPAPTVGVAAVPPASPRPAVPAPASASTVAAVPPASLPPVVPATTPPAQLAALAVSRPTVPAAPTLASPPSTVTAAPQAAPYVPAPYAPAPYAPAPFAPTPFAPAPFAPAPAVSPVVPAPIAASAPPAPGFASLAPAPVSATFDIAPPVVAAAAPPPSAAPPASVTAVRSEDSILARIVASITIPGEELGVTAPARPQPVVAARALEPEPAVDPEIAKTFAAVRARAARETADRAAAARTIAAAVKARPNQADAKPSAAERRLAERKAADKKLAEDKAAEAKATRGEPARIWVQVAGGASERDLPSAWASAQGKAGALKGRAAYTTPLRATNRVVTGPFKTDAEARALVNQLAKQGVSAFTFSSAVGQKMIKLPSR